MARLLIGSAIVVSSVLSARLAFSQTDAAPGAPSANAPGNPPPAATPAPPNAPNGSYPPPAAAPPTGAYPPATTAPPPPANSYPPPASAPPQSNTYTPPGSPPPSGYYPPPASAPPPNNSYQQAPPPSGYYPPPASAPPPNNSYQQPASAPPPNSGTAYGNQPPPRGTDDVGRSDVAEPPPPPAKEGKPFEIPDWSVRVDPLNWLIYGRLGLELEVALWKFISVEMVPMFVTNDHPPAMNLGSFPANLYQDSNGLGAMSGTSIGAGFWLSGKPFDGTVLRFYFTNYGYKYTAKPDTGLAPDVAVHTDRHLVGYLGSHHRWGFFTIAYGLGLGVEMNRERRCVNPDNTISTDCPKDVFELKLGARGETVNIYDWLHPVYISSRLALGVVF